MRQVAGLWVRPYNDPGFTHAPRLRFEARLLKGEVSEMELLLI